MESLFFILFAAASVFSALMVILQKNPVSSVLFLALTFFCLAALFVLLSAPFIAAIQVIVYTGAVMVLFLFVIMLLNLRHFEESGALRGKILGVAAAGLFLISAAALVRSVALPADSGFLRSPSAGFGSVEQIGYRLFTVYLLPVEIAGFLLLAGIIGAIVISKKKL